MKSNDKERLDAPFEECHGIYGDEKWPKPYCVAKSEIPNRKDQNNMITASEYLDEPEVLEKKMEIIAELIKSSKCCIAYTGAGLSRAAGIGDYGSKAENSITKDVKKLSSAFDAKPTYSHHVLAKLEEIGYLKYYVQQNHDGLPQKAGFPQEKINEIHGAWYDPSNPVVQFKESLRTDLFNWMTDIEERADFCLCLGTSLSGMNADRCALSPAERFWTGRMGNGTVMINLQRTKIDPMCTIRVWSKIDEAFKILAKKLNIDMTKLRSAPKFEQKQDLFFIPYDENGKFLGKKTTKLMKLDLSNGAKVKIVNQGSSVKNVVGTILRKSEDSFTWTKPGKDGGQSSNYALGNWMIDAGVRGALDTFPYANEKPSFVNMKFEYKEVKKEKEVLDYEEELIKEIERKSLLELSDNK